MERHLIGWQYCKNLNDINTAIKEKDENWEGLTDAKQIISITYDSNHGCYVVFWRCLEVTVETSHWIQAPIVLTCNPPKYMWVCDNCGHNFAGYEAPENCPSCNTYMIEPIESATDIHIGL